MPELAGQLKEPRPRLKVAHLVNHESGKHAAARCAFLRRYFAEKVRQPWVMSLQSY